MKDDDRMRSAKQLCKKDPGPTSIDGYDLTTETSFRSAMHRAVLSQGCLPTSLYSSDAYQTPNGQTIPFVYGDEFFFNNIGLPSNNGYLLNPVDPYASTTQSRNLRVIQSELTPTYRAKNDTFELNADFAVTPALMLSSQTGYNKDELRSTEDFNRFNTASDLFAYAPAGTILTAGSRPYIAPEGVFCDPQLGLFVEDGGRGPVAGARLAVLAGSAPGLAFRGAVQFQPWCQLHALPDRRRLLRLQQRDHGHHHGVAGQRARPIQPLLRIQRPHADP